MPTLSAPTPTPATPAARRYYIMGAASLPDGTAFAVSDSHHYLLTEFALGFLSVQQVVDALAAGTPAAAPAR